MGAHHKRNKHELHVGGIVYFLVIYSYFIITRASEVQKNCWHFQVACELKTHRVNDELMYETGANESR